jgi:hypothetical protein
MKLFKIKANESVFDFSSANIIFVENKITEESRKSISDYLNTIVEVMEYKDSNDFINIVSSKLSIDNKETVGNTIDVHTTPKNIYQMCYVEFSKEPLNFIGTIINNKRKIVNGDVYVFANSLLTTKIDDNAKPKDFISQCDMSFDELINVILNNYYFKGVCFDGDKYYPFIFDNNMKVLGNEKLKDYDLSKLLFKRSDLLNFTIDIFYEDKGDQIKAKYNTKLSSFYIEDFKGKVFMALKSENEKKYNDLDENEEYIKRIIMIQDKYCYDDSDISIPRDFKFYEYQDNDKYTNKYIVFDNLFDKIILTK